MYEYVKITEKTKHPSSLRAVCLSVFLLSGAFNQTQTRLAPPSLRPIVTATACVEADVEVHSSRAKPARTRSTNKALSLLFPFFLPPFFPATASGRGEQQAVRGSQERRAIRLHRLNKKEGGIAVLHIPPPSKRRTFPATLCICLQQAGRRALEIDLLPAGLWGERKRGNEAAASRARFSYIRTRTQHTINAAAAAGFVLNLRLAGSVSMDILTLLRRPPYDVL